MLIFRSLLVLALALCLVLGSPLAALEGAVRAVDGDSLEVGGEKIRLFGIDAPELNQRCDRAGQSWRCGHWARGVLADLVAGQSLRCDRVDTDRYGRTVATCHAGSTDLAEAMARLGAATAYRLYTSRYVAAERAAKAEGLGIWAARMVTPEAHRQQTAPAPQAAPGDCAIKGNIGASGKRIYHMPGQQDYAATRIDPRKGEAWFCSEAEARAAGFRRAAR